MEEQQTLHYSGSEGYTPQQGNQEVTMRLNTSVTPKSPNGRTSRNSKTKGLPVKELPVHGDIFVLAGEIYHKVRILSQSSGEAQVILVQRESKNYVLKLYYPGYIPEKDVLQVVWNMDFEMIVRLYDYGETFVEGAKREYELMEWLEGISLADYKLGQNKEQFKKIALATAAALEYCHNCNLIHKDVKLGNFIFRDKAMTNPPVLTDFGISTLIDDKEIIHKTTQARTPLYAAPEMYDNVIDGEVELTPAADYYSLGIVLFFLWLGSSPFAGNERAMMRMKNEGRLPNLDKLPEDVRNLVRGLTVVNPDKRWGYYEVERWYAGEVVDVDEASIYLRYKPFIVDSEKNIIANDAQELAALLAVRKHLGIKYLYSKVISVWLEECGNQKLAVELDDIVDKRYPLTPEIGFQAALYTLDKKLPYHAGKGHTCNNVHEIVMDILANIEDYKIMLQDENHPLYVYLEMTTELEVNRLKDHFKTNKPEIAIWRFIFEIDNTIPFLTDKPSQTIDEIIQSFAERDCKEDEWISLTDGRLLSWLYYKSDPLRYITLKEVYDQHLPYSRSEAYRILYLLDRNVGFDLHNATERHQIAAIMSEQLMKAQNLDKKSFGEALEEYIKKESRLVYYAQIHGWQDVIMLHKQIFSLQEFEQSSRYGIYDEKIAAYRFCKALGGKPEYYLRTNGRLITTLEQYQELDSKTKRAEIRGGSMKQWLTIFFHENPNETFENKFSYEQALGNYLTEIGKSDSNDPHFKRFKHACEAEQNKLNTARLTSNSIHSQEKRLSFIFFASVLILCTLIVYFQYPNPTSFLQYVPILIGIPTGLTGITLTASWSYFHGNGFLANFIWGGIGGLISGIFPVFLFGQIGAEETSSLVIASIVMIGICTTLAVFFGKRKSIHKYKELKKLFHEDTNATLIDALYYTFRQKSNQFKGSNHKALEDATGIMKAARIEYLVHYLIWILFTWTLIVLFVAFHPALLAFELPDIGESQDYINKFINLFNTSDIQL